MPLDIGCIYLTVQEGQYSPPVEFQMYMVVKEVQYSALGHREYICNNIEGTV